MSMVDNIAYELEGRVKSLDLGKTHFSVRYEPNSRIVRVGACLRNYDWETRSQMLDVLLDLEDSHADQFALEFDIIPLEAVTDTVYAEI